MKASPLISPCVGELHDHWTCLLLGTDYKQFFSEYGISGLCRVTDKQIEFLAVDADAPGTGQFRRFIKACQEQYAVICVWHDWNPILGPMLQRYGFVRCNSVDPVTADALTGWRWSK